MIMNGLKWFFRLFVYYILFLIPRTSKKWLYFGTFGQFIDNTKYAFLYANKCYGGYRHIWMTEDKIVFSFLKERGFEVCLSNSLHGIYHQLTSKVIVFDSILERPFLTGGALRCDLWHGIPLKKIGYDDKIHILSEDTLRGKIRRKYAPDSLVLCTSYQLLDIFSSAFNIVHQNIVVGGYFRIMPFCYTPEELEKHFESYESQSMQELYALLKKRTFAKVIIYMPTFRDGNPDFLNKAIPDFIGLNEFCREHNLLLLLKLHRTCTFPLHQNTFSNILNLNYLLDVYPLLPLTDILVTDYSSIFFDYSLLHGKKVIYYPFDIEEYKCKSREMYFDYESVVGDIVCMNMQELMSAILSDNSDKMNIKRNFYDLPLDYDSLFQEICCRI